MPDTTYHKSTATSSSRIAPDHAGAGERTDEGARLRRLAQLGEMTATAVHEIRSPLAGIVGLAELLVRQCHSDSDAQRMAERLHAAAGELMMTIDRMLEFVRDTRLARRPIDWSKFVTVALDQYQDNLQSRGSRLVLKRSVPERLGWGLGDVLCLRQAVWNVLDNADHALNGDGHVVVTAESRASRLCLSIADSGPGIDSGNAERLFLPFVSESGGGTGLGLPMARKIIEAHDGTITLANDPSTGGAVARIELPITPAAANDAGRG